MNEDTIYERGLRFSIAVPETEFDVSFAQGMVDRMGVSFFKYGPLAEAYPERVNAIESLKARLEKYARTGNTEFLMDAANFAMIEFMRPSHPEAHFKATDSNESPGRKWNGQGEVDLSQRSHRVVRRH